MVITVTRAAARRFLLATQGLLEAPGVSPWERELKGESGVIAALERLEAVQLDPIAVVERNHHLVLRNRVGGYRPQQLDRLFAARRVFEHLANARCVMPMADLRAFWPIMLAARRLPARSPLAGSMEDVMAHLRSSGEAQPRELGNDGPRLMGIGYNPADKASKASGRALDLLWLGGEIMVSRRRGNEKWYDLADRCIPPKIAAGLPDEMVVANGLALASEFLTTDTSNTDTSNTDTSNTGTSTSDTFSSASPEGGPPSGEAQVSRPWSAPNVAQGPAPWQEFLLQKYMRAYRLADLGDFRFGWQSYTAAQRREIAAERVAVGDWVEVAVEGVRRRYYALAVDRPLLEEAEGWEARGPVRFIAPLDNLLWRRPRLQDLFEFDYTWEVYTPAAKRQFGYYAMPILYQDRLIGRMDPRLDRKQGVLVVNLLHLEPNVKVTAPLKRALATALCRFARWHGASAITVAATEPAIELEKVVL